MWIIWGSGRIGTAVAVVVRDSVTWMVDVAVDVGERVAMGADMDVAVGVGV